ncbi:MAG: DUF547 domain-containing protein [Planctomycetes bacterium]|nr:DUF547 domain-containing protein [Planctomycetota bacterium]
MAVLVCLVVGVGGCSVRVKPPTDPSRFAMVNPDEAWSRVLEKRVDDRGRIDFAGLKADSKDLDAFVYWISEVSPETDPGRFPTREAKIAYYLNSYNAIAMYNVVNSGVLPEDKTSFFYIRELCVGGSYTSLYTYENSVVRPLGEPRVHFALNCMVRGCPRLPRVPFRADQLDAQLDAAAKVFFNEERNVVLQPERKVVRFNSILDFYTSDFLAAAPSLIEYANRYRTSKIATDWSVEFIPYDFTLNSQ